MSLYSAHPTALAGCVELRPRVHRDARGSFVKFFHAPSFAALGLPFTLAETFVTQSEPGVLRGLHCQWPPHQHVKLVSCLAGEVFDAVVDLRRDSPTYGQHAALTLSAALGNLLYIPPGLAHGFCTTAAPATLLYQVSSAHSPAQDGGIRWDSAGIAWPLAAPLISERDLALPALSDIASPFGAPANVESPSRQRRVAEGGQ